MLDEPDDCSPGFGAWCAKDVSSPGHPCLSGVGPEEPAALAVPLYIGGLTDKVRRCPFRLGVTRLRLQYEKMQAKRKRSQG